MIFQNQPVQGQNHVSLMMRFWTVPVLAAFSMMTVQKQPVFSMAVGQSHLSGEMKLMVWMVVSQPVWKQF
jgi:hypothetical protein